MKTTTTISGTTATITFHTDIDFESLPEIESAVTLPATVTDVTWNLENTPFMDVTGLRLLQEQRDAARARKGSLTVTGLHSQPQRLLQTAAELFPAMDWDQFLPRPTHFPAPCLSARGPGAVGIS
ncbi:STAS domain-containing protein [Streptomyces sp. NBC_00467]|uniref:STAS domain-containing protein n=1 Tax=Streptomyces sp. NBC_00467 TaxID=2975752 RepID=UPI002E17CCA7